MTQSGSHYITTNIEPEDASSGFSCGKHALDDYFNRHALPNDRAGIGRAYVLRRRDHDPAELPRVLGYYTLSMALAESAQLAPMLAKKLPKYPMPVALIGRLAIDARAQRRRLGEALLLDAAAIVGCTGIVVDAKDEDAERFYDAYDFVTLATDAWPRRMFLPLVTAKASFEDT